MDPRATLPSAVPLHLTSFAILSPSNAPLHVQSYTGEGDHMRYFHLSHSALDVIEEKIATASQSSRPPESYLGLLFCMEDMAIYGYQTPSKLRLVLTIAMVDAVIKDSDILAIFRSIHNLILQTTSNPFIGNTSAPSGLTPPNGPADIKPEWFATSSRFKTGARRLGELLDGGLNPNRVRL